MTSSDETVSYAWPSTVAFANFVKVMPCIKGKKRSDFKIWRKQMLCLLESQEVAGFVDGRTPPPPEDEEQQKKMWRRSDLLVQGWILGSIGKDALDIVWDKPTAKEMWLELETIFKEKVQEEHGRKEEDEEKEEEERKGESEKDKGGVDGDFSSYSSLYQAAVRGDWNTAENFFSDINQLSTTVISSKSETTLHVASKIGKSKNLDFVKTLVELMPREDLALQDSNGNTALVITIMVGNTEAAKAMVIKNPALLNILNKFGQLPIHVAAVISQKETLEYLLCEHEKSVEGKTLFEGQTGIKLLNAILASQFVDIALDLVHKYPNLAHLTYEEGDWSALSTISKKPSLFVRIETLSWWHKFIYHRIPVKKSLCVADTTYVGRDDVESLCSQKKNYSTSFQLISQVGLNKLEILIWHVIEILVPKVKELREKKAQRQRALQLVQFLCDKIVSLPQNKASTIFRKSAFLAAEEGISEIVEMIIQKCPDITFESDPKGNRVFLIAATYRFENVINILYSMSDRKYLSYDRSDKEYNNLMHICGKLAPSHRLNLVAGAALQMQRELQWFKEMEKFVSPSRRTRPNKKTLTPQQLFTEEHMTLKADGERWMKDTANACTIAAALIATVMFAAAFTLPGGLDSSTGIPLLSGKPSFMLFAISDAISLFASINSLLMFLSILTSRYAEEDFLYVLPKRLSMGLLSLFVSITFMMVAFSATLYLVFRREVTWFIVLLAAFAFFPVTSFVLLQFPLLVDVLYLTYGPGIFGKKSSRILY